MFAIFHVFFLSVQIYSVRLFSVISEPSFGSTECLDESFHDNKRVFFAAELVSAALEFCPFQC